MRTQKLSRLVILALFLCVSWRCSAAATVAPRSSAASVLFIQLSPEQSYIDLDSPGRSNAQRQVRTSVHVTVTGATASSMHPILIYACMTTEEGMRAAGKSLTLAITTLRIRNDRGEWAELEPLAELEGRRGVRIAVVNRVSATVLLEIQMNVPPSQTAGNYQGILMLQAQEQK